MLLDLDLVREILIAIEALPANRHAQPFSLAGHDEDVVFEHLELLKDHGLIKATIGSLDNTPKRIVRPYVQGLTWEGHDFLANARNEEIWSKTQAMVKEKGGSASFEIITGLLTQAAIKVFGLG